MSDTPAAVMTYDSLIEDIQAYAQKDDTRFVTQIPRIVMLAENRVASEVRGLGFLRSVTSSFVIGASGSVIAKPPRWRETVSFNYADANSQRQFLVKRSYEYCRRFWPITSDTDNPRFYADYDYNRWLVAPSPGTDFDFEVMYHERPRPLSSAATTSWTTEFAPQLLLFACLLESVLFTKDYEVQPTWQAAYDRAAQALTIEDKERTQDRAATQEKK